MRSLEHIHAREKCIEQALSCKIETVFLALCRHLSVSLFMPHSRNRGPIQPSQNDTECHFVSRSLGGRLARYGGRRGLYQPSRPGNCARTTRQSQLLLTDIRLMIVCASQRTRHDVTSSDYGA